MLLFLLFFIFSSVRVQCLTTQSKIYDSDENVGRIITMDLDSKLTCFYEPMEANYVLTLGMRPANEVRFPMQFRLTSPSGDFSDWAAGMEEANMEHNTTENGDYEICLYAPREIRATLFMQFYNPEKMEKSIKSFFDKHQISQDIQNSMMASTHRVYKIYYSVKFQNQMIVRDEALQIQNGEYIQNYSIIFCVTSVLIAIFEVYYVRRLFHVDPKKIRI